MRGSNPTMATIRFRAFFAVCVVALISCKATNKVKPPDKGPERCASVKSWSHSGGSYGPRFGDSVIVESHEKQGDLDSALAVLDKAAQECELTEVCRRECLFPTNFAQAPLLKMLGYRARVLKALIARATGTPEEAHYNELFAGNRERFRRYEALIKGQQAAAVAADRAVRDAKRRDDAAELRRDPKRLEWLSQKTDSGPGAAGDLVKRARGYDLLDDPDRALALLDDAERESLAQEELERGSVRTGVGWLRMAKILMARRVIIAGFLERTQGTAEEAHYRELATDLDKRWVLLKAQAEARDQAQASAVAAERDARERAKFARDVEAGKREQQAYQRELAVTQHKEHLEQVERDKGIAKYGACDACGGTGKIHWIYLGSRYPSASDNYVAPCGRCKGTGYKGDSYSIWNSD